MFFVAQIVQNDVFYYYLEIFGTTTTTWNCINGNCVDPGTGTGAYTSLATCQSNCGMPTTYVPDNNFEAYLEANGMGNGIANDYYVTTSNINTVTTLYANSLLYMYID